MGVAVLDEASGQPHLAGEFTGGGQPLAGAEAARADRVPQLPLQLGAQLLAALAVDGQEQFG
ncbi:hypothetical protein O1M63_36155 [Streptomyces mirabilis]|nr:hypothetical protein [Streptomyces mirabilis]